MGGGLLGPVGVDDGHSHVAAPGKEVVDEAASGDEFIQQATAGVLDHAPRVLKDQQDVVLQGRHGHRWAGGDGLQVDSDGHLQNSESVR